MSEPHPEIEGSEAYKPIIYLLEQRRALQESAVGPRWFQKFQSIGVWLALPVAPAFLVVAATGGLAGWSRPLVLYPLVLATLALLLAGAIAFATMVVLMWRCVRSKRTWRTPIQVIVTDCLLAERLAACSVLELRTLRHVLAARLDRFRERQMFTLGPAAKISPFLILLVFLLFSKTELEGLVTQIAPSAAKLASSPLGAFFVCLVTFAVVLVRFRAYFEDETVSVDLMLIDGALERINSTKGAQSLHGETTTTTGSTAKAPTPADEDAAPQFAPMLPAQGSNSM